MRLITTRLPLEMKDVRNVLTAEQMTPCTRNVNAKKIIILAMMKTDHAMVLFLTLFTELKLDVGRVVSDCKLDICSLVG